MRYTLLFLLAFSTVFAAPAYDKVRTFTQADGTTFKARAQGNHHLHWIESSDGEILRYNKATQNFDYAIIQKNKLKASGASYNTQNSIRARSIARIPKLTRKEVYELWAKKRKEAHH